MTRKKTAASGGQPPLPFDAEIALPEEARRRYLNYALSVITSRALPDVRDGLKPVQRRILFAMFQNLHLTPDAKFKKSASVVGDVIGKYHPHGDVAIYDAMVRMAQPFSLRAPLVDGHGNFGSLDGDSAAAYRYTEARLKPLAIELLSEIRKKTVELAPELRRRSLRAGRPPGPLPEPPRERRDRHRGRHGDVHPAAQPRRGARRRDRGGRRRGRRSAPARSRVPTSRRAASSSAASARCARSTSPGRGRSSSAAEWEVEEGSRGAQSIVITSIPYAQEKANLARREDRGRHHRAEARRSSWTSATSRRTTSGSSSRSSATTDPALVMTYLYKHTPLETTVPVNLTCLVPGSNPEVGEPQRACRSRRCSGTSSTSASRPCRRRFDFDLEELRRRIHLLEGFVVIYDALDEAIRIIRKSDGKADAAEKLMKRFGLDDEQVDAILETKLYKLARLEIDAIRAELKEKKVEAAAIEAILKSTKKLWNEVKGELGEVRETLAGEKRRTKVPARRRGARIRRRGLHPARGHLRNRDDRRLAQAPARAEGRPQHPASRRRRGAGRDAGLDEGARGALLEPRDGLRPAPERRPAVDGLRRARPEALQVRRRRARRGGALPRPACHAAEERRRPRRHAAGLRLPVLGGPVSRGDDARRPALRAARQGRRDRARLRLRRDGRRRARLRAGAGDPLPGDGSARPRGPGQGRPRLQARARTTGWSAQRFSARTRSARRSRS